MTAGER